MICEKFVTAAIILRDDRVLLARRSSGQKLAGFWEFPGGKVEAGETPESCLARELEEELGIGVHVGRKFAESLHQVPITGIFVSLHFSRIGSPGSSARVYTIAWNG